MPTDQSGPASSSPPAQRDAAYFDRWYADMTTSEQRDEIVARTMGLPSEMAFASLLTWDAIAEVEEALLLHEGGLLLDLACGRGGYGIEVARRSGAQLVGVDFSTVALRAARASSARLLPEGRADFFVSSLVDVGLLTGTVDAVMCVDSVQFAEPPAAVLREVRRLLRPGGQVALTCWEAADPTDERVPRRIRAVDLRRDLAASGFEDVRVHGKPVWRQAERALWEAALAAPSGPDAAVRALQDEGRASREAFDSLTRVLATATSP